MPKVLNEKQQPDWIEAEITDKGGWANKLYGVRGGSRGDTFYGPERWIKELQKNGMARPVPASPKKEAKGPETTKPAAPSKTKPAKSSRTKSRKK